ncbi:hypothetical protein I7I50_08529 [Histoplasma capsulatum G186AR]|nr:hypothetical protein I7I50_08529 [Histoplasma capsulatum G186AR]
MAGSSWLSPCIRLYGIFFFSKKKKKEKKYTRISRSRVQYSTWKGAWGRLDPSSRRADINIQIYRAHRQPGRSTSAMRAGKSSASEVQ